MDLGDLTQLVLVVAAAFAFGRVVSVVVRLIERRAALLSPLAPDTDERLRALEEECGALRQELNEIAERQDFSERVLLQHPGRAIPIPSSAPRERIVTPH
jgi:hypothetical protein